MGKFENTWNYEQKSLKNLEFLTIFTCLVVKFCFDSEKNILQIIFFEIIKNFFPKKHI